MGGGCAYQDDVNHLFLKYDFFFFKVWSFVSHWPDFVTVTPTRILDRLLQFNCLGGLSKKFISILQLIWLSTDWVIWKERNSRTFKHKEETLHFLTKLIYNLLMVESEIYCLHF